MASSRFASGMPPAHVVAHLTENPPPASQISSLILEPLLSYAADGSLLPTLVTEVPSKANGGLSDDLTKVTLNLRDDVLWSDGEPFTADDVVWTWQWITDESNGAIEPLDMERDPVNRSDQPNAGAADLRETDAGLVLSDCRRLRRQHHPPPRLERPGQGRGQRGIRDQPDRHRTVQDRDVRSGGPYRLFDQRALPGAEQAVFRDRSLPGRRRRRFRRPGRSPKRRWRTWRRSCGRDAKSCRKSRRRTARAGWLPARQPMSSTSCSTSPTRTRRSTESARACRRPTRS